MALIRALLPRQLTARARQVRPVCIDRYGLLLRVTGPSEAHDVRLPFALAVTTAGESPRASERAAVPGGRIRRDNEVGRHAQMAWQRVVTASNHQHRECGRADQAYEIGDAVDRRAGLQRRCRDLPAQSVAREHSAGASAVRSSGHPREVAGELPRPRDEPPGWWPTWGGRDPSASVPLEPGCFTPRLSVHGLRIRLGNQHPAHPARRHTRAAIVKEKQGKRPRSGRERVIRLFVIKRGSRGRDTNPSLR